jgi:glutamate 5-kinase
VVSSRELQFSDNDELATIIAAGFGAQKLMICTKSGGLLNNEKEVIPTVKEIDNETMKLVDNKMSTSGLGGMASKLTFTKRATAVGIEVIVFGINESNGILSAFEGNSGTRFLPKTGFVSVRNKWLASGSVATGQVVLDDGAVVAIRNRKSLLSVGVKAIKGEFQIGEFIELLNTKNESIAVAKSKLSSVGFTKDVSVLVAHADDIVLL